MLLLKLILAHLIGDYLLQPFKWVQDKEANKIRAKSLYFHVILHGVLAFIILLPHSLDQLILVPLYILISHWLIDLSKLYLQGKNQKTWFLTDQIAHLIVIILLWMHYQAGWDGLSFLFTGQNLLLLTCVLFLTQPASIIIMILISGWSPEEKTGDEKYSLAHAGKYIGILERLFVFGFVVGGFWQGVGFLLAAKSVFRFGDLRKAGNLKFTEYILIGTLLSFGIAVVTALIYVYASATLG